MENADRLARLLRHDKVLPDLSESDLEDLTIYLARNAKNVERALKGKEPDLGQGDEEPAAADNIARLKAAN